MNSTKLSRGSLNRRSFATDGKTEMEFGRRLFFFWIFFCSILIPVLPLRVRIGTMWRGDLERHVPCRARSLKVGGERSRGLQLLFKIPST